MWNELPEASRAAIEVAERFADGQASRQEYRASRRKAAAVAYDGLTGDESWWRAFWGKLNAGDWGYDGRLDFVALNTDSPSELRSWANDMQTYTWAEVKLGWIHDLFGNPFRPAILDATLRPPAVLALAQAAYDNRELPAGTLEPERLAVLADALEEAGCQGHGLLNHLRGGGVHVRGCRAVDAILGKS